MNKLETFAYYLGYYTSYAKDFFRPRATWLLPFLVGIATGIIICRYLVPYIHSLA